MPGNQGIMLLCELKSVPLGMQGDDPLDNLANSLFYAKERETWSRIRGWNPKNLRVLCLIDQQSQCFVGISLVESFEADSEKLRVEARELLREILAFVSNRFAIM